MKVVIVESDPTLRKLIVERYQRDGHQVLADVGRLVIADVVAHNPELLVLEAPAGAELERVTLVRRRTAVPMVVVLGLDCEHSDADVLDAGADDVLRKPLSLRDLMARCRALLRRTSGTPSGGVLEFPGLRIDRSTRLVHLDGRGPLELAHREFDLLAHLAASPRQVFSREQLLAAVWGSSDAWQGTATVTEHIYRLRRRLGPLGDACLVTVRSVGYRFNPPTAAEPAAEPIAGPPVSSRASPSPGPPAAPGRPAGPAAAPRRRR